MFDLFFNFIAAELQPMPTIEPIISQEMNDKIDLLAFHLAPLLGASSGPDFKDLAAPFVDTIDRILKTVEGMKIHGTEFPDHAAMARAIIQREVMAAIGIRMTDLFGKMSGAAIKLSKDANKRAKKRFGWRHRGEK
jgi:hypothetical protein